MSVVIDTSIWSQFFRRKIPDDPSAVEMVGDLILNSKAVLVGIVKQELLSGIKEPERFKKLLSALSGFEPLLATDEDHILAGRYFTKCRSEGIQGSFSDFLICAQATNNRMSILSVDGDFMHYSKHIPIRLAQEV
jgi:predicted nucleic acid-binding protein